MFAVLVSVFFNALPVFAQPPGAGPGFVLLDFKTPANVNLGQWLKWVYPGSHVNNPNPHPGPQGSRRGAFGPMEISYSVDANFMSNQDPETFANAKAAVESALQTWSQATNGYVRFPEAPWPPVVNITNDPANYPFPHYAGPGLNFWCGNYACAPCVPCASTTLFPGLGADIDFFTRPIGWQLTSNGFTYTMSSGILGFTTVHRNSDGIWIIDIYLNRDFQWTTNPSLARAPASPVKYACDPLSPLDIPVGGGPANELGATVYDIETVVLHELGHALGFDHPNEACLKGAAVLDPYTHEFLPCGSFTPACAMHGAYNGVKRELAPADIGALAFLYKPRKAGDVDADDSLTVSDGAHAMHLFQNPDEATPYEVAALDFINHNGRIDVDEVLLLLYWILDPDGFVPGLVLNASSMAPERAVTSLSAFATSEPPDAGLAKSFSITFTIDNPDAVAVAGWDLLITYDPAVFSNPTISNGTILPAASWGAVGSTPGVARFAKLGFPPGDQSATGTLGTVTFDVNLTAAALTPDLINFPLTRTDFAIVDPINQMIRIYGSSPNDTLSVETPQAMSYFYDIDGNECVDIEDAYAYVADPADVTKNGSITDHDRASLNEGLRYRELPLITNKSP